MPILWQSCRGFRAERTRAATLLCPLLLRLAPRIDYRVVSSGKKVRPVYRRNLRIGIVEPLAIRRSARSASSKHTRLVTIYPETILTSLSASARTRCIERLTCDPSEWPMDDYDDVTIGHWRRLIPPADHLGALIGLLADALMRKRGRPTATNSRGPTLNPTNLLLASAQNKGRRLRLGRPTYQAIGVAF